ncbi:MAG: putative rane protein [Verrucomicrobiales bacterium]|nr:putative rane protein [Verrucomicrobiales bacterium]
MVAGLILAGLAGVGLAAESGSGAPMDYARDIKPIFESRCYDCHGAKKQKNGLRLDLKEAALRGGDEGKPEWIPGKSGESRIIARVTSTDPDEVMPPKGDHLTTDQIKTLRQWIDEGAIWPESAAEVPAKKHWAYLPPVKAPLPGVQDPAWSKNPIDRFVLVRLQKEGLKPSAHADAPALLRRMSLDLTGLPPTLEEADRFLADATPEAYSKMIEHYLASPQYGENWARLWLDLARYADSHGYEKDPGRKMWPYRDWVINALNQNMKFDQFTIEQIAGDLLPNATESQKVASGFHRNTMFNTEGGVDKEQSRMETIVDRVNTTATVWLGSTLNCAQCHTHKYDPFTIKEYYRFMAYFNNCDEPQLEVPSKEQAAKRAELQPEVARLEKVLETPTPQLEAEQASWEYKTATVQPHWIPLDPAGFLSSGGATITKLSDKSLLVGGNNPTNDTYIVVANTPSSKITALRLEVLPDESLPQHSSGRDANGSFVVSAVDVTAAPLNQPSATRAVKFKTAVADYTQNGHSATNLIDGKNGTGWAVDAGTEKGRVERYVELEPETPISFASGGTLTITLKNGTQWGTANPGRFRISVTTNETPLAAPLIPAPTLKILAIAPLDRSEADKINLATYYRTISPALKESREMLAAKKKELDELQRRIPSTLVMQEKAQSRDTFVLARGNFSNKGEKVTPGVPAIFGISEDQEPTNRLGLARWLVATNNPLTARVMVNRVWAQYFGKGLVETEEDFGTQGASPSHPELLDWLAADFMATGWNLKALHRTIVTSMTYQQSSVISPELEEKDPSNRWLARGPRFRVPAENVRDIALSVSGLLRRKVGGPSVYPPQPDGIWTQIYGDEKWTTSEGDDRYRRGLYSYAKRTSPYPTFASFDAPSREVCTARRPRTNTPLQALSTLNDPAFIEAAQVLARKVASNSAPEPEQRVSLAFRLCLTRKPAPQEVERLVKLYNTELEHYKLDAKAAVEMAFGAGAKPMEGFDVPELAAWTVVANVLLNLDETITKS